MGEGIARRREFFEREGLGWDTTFFDERAFLRKAQYMSGWDWGPRLVSCGLWRPVRLVECDARLVDLEIATEPIGGGKFRLRASPVLEGVDPEDVRLRFDGGEFLGAIDLEVRPRLWNPRGLGEPHLYPIGAVLGEQRIDKRIGFRTIRLVQERDAWGESFAFEVNGERVFARGANWIPNDCFPSQTSDESVAAAIGTLAALNADMVRVWGGGIYESEAFYDACDAEGVMVWQDFPFACSYYPDDEGFADLVRREAEVQVRRLRHRASLALWCGNNECHTMAEQRWGGDDVSPPRFYGRRLYEEVLAAVVSALDPGRPYVAGSPLGASPDGSPDRAGNTGANMGGFGDQHYWDAWHGRGDWRHYRDSHARFCSEFGFASACGPEAWRLAFGGPASSDPLDAVVRAHDRTGKPFEVFAGLVAEHYPDAATLEEWVYFSQLNQRDALRFAIEHYRTSGFCEGALIWQFNDCWPSQSWAVEDFARRLKPAGYELRRLFSPVLLAVIVEGTRARVLGVADRDESRDVTVRFFSASGRRLDSPTWEGAVRLGRKATLVGEWEISGLDRRRTLVRARIEGEAGSERWACLAEPKEMLWERPRFRAERAGDRLEIGVEGVAFDLVVTDLASGERLLPEDEPLPGARPVVLVDEGLRFRCPPSALRLSLRHLGGTEERAVP